MDDSIQANAAAFSSALMDLADHVDGEITKVIRKACIDLYRRIVERTPVDTGRAKGNWQLSTYFSEAEKGDKDGFTFNEVREVINAEVREFKVDLNDNTVIIYNNLEYISILESGTGSRQAPQGMVAVSLAEFEQHFRAALAGADL